MPLAGSDVKSARATPLVVRCTLQRGPFLDVKQAAGPRQAFCHAMALLNVKPAVTGACSGARQRSESVSQRGAAFSGLRTRMAFVRTEGPGKPSEKKSRPSIKTLSLHFLAQSDALCLCAQRDTC